LVQTLAEKFAPFITDFVGAQGISKNGTVADISKICGTVEISKLNGKR
jgi:hypothetical protein